MSDLSVLIMIDYLDNDDHLDHDGHLNHDDHLDYDDHLDHDDHLDPEDHDAHCQIDLSESLLEVSDQMQSL